MSGKRSRRKGANWEREVAGMFREIMPGEGVKRGFQYRDGEEAPDVMVPCFWVECKVGSRTNIKGALEQADGCCPPKNGKWPLAICKDDRKTPIASMYLEDFLELVGEWWRLTNE